MAEATEREFLEGLRYEDKYPAEERAELYVTQESRWTDDVVRLARALITAESERAELAREVEELRGALANASDALPDPMHPAFPRELVDGQVDALAIIADALSEPTEGE